MTYDRLDRDSNALARGLASAGLKKGDRCAVALGNGIEFATVCEFVPIIPELEVGGTICENGGVAAY